MKLNRIKKYKASLPEDTINKIKTVLESLGMEFQEEEVHGNNLFKALSLSVINPENKEMVFRTYGKGTTNQWARASAYGEMIERIQNHAFYSTLYYPTQPKITNKNYTGFKYYPDEKVFSLKDNKSLDFITNYQTLTSLAQNEILSNSAIGIPYINLFENKTEYFPFRAMQAVVGSNGMCSGNTREEALIQGISEVFERYVLKSFYLSPFCPPEIPLMYFEGTDIYHKINQLEKKHNFLIEIKDCSLGKGYPVIGIFVENCNGGYAFHLGADPSPVTALERCFTEIFQGGSICFQSINELNMNLPYNLDSDFWKKNLSQTISAYAGQWPNAIFKDTPSYPFTGFDHPISLSDKEDLNYLLNILKRENKKIYIQTSGNLNDI